MGNTLMLWCSAYNTHSVHQFLSLILVALLKTATLLHLIQTLHTLPRIVYHRVTSMSNTSNLYIGRGESQGIRGKGVAVRMLNGHIKWIRPATSFHRPKRYFMICIHSLVRSFQPSFYVASLLSIAAIATRGRTQKLLPHLPPVAVSDPLTWTFSTRATLANRKLPMRNRIKRRRNSYPDR